uniref:C2H2-type domain-containing protein n=1 Tax=Macrostomum lignano TaxID=282301 RepID=A0A1I8J0J5_9PLAT
TLCRLPVRGVGSIVCLSAAVGIGIGGVIAYRLNKQQQQQQQQQQQRQLGETSETEGQESLLVEEEEDCCTCGCGCYRIKSAQTRTRHLPADAVEAGDASVGQDSLSHCCTSLEPAPALPNGSASVAPMGNTQQHQRQRNRAKLPTPLSCGSCRRQPVRRESLTRHLLGYDDPDDDDSDDNFGEFKGSRATAAAGGNQDFLIDSAEEALPDGDGSAAAATAASVQDVEFRTDSLRAVSSLESVNRDSWFIHSGSVGNSAVAWPGTCAAAPGSPPRQQSQQPSLPGYVNEHNQDLFHRVLHIYARVHSNGDSNAAVESPSVDPELPADADAAEFLDTSLGAEFARRRDEFNSKKPQQQHQEAAEDELFADREDADDEDDELTRQQLLTSLRQGESLFSDCAASSTAVATSACWLMEDSGIDFASASVDPPLAGAGATSAATAATA